MPATTPEDWSLFDHLAFLFRHWPLLLAGVVVCGGLAFAAKRLMPVRERAVGLLRVGTAYSIGILEKPADVAARVASPAFLGAVIAASPKDFDGGRLGLGLSATVPEGSQLVRLTATAPTVAEAEALVRDAARRIVADHRRPYDRVRAIVEANLQDLDKEAATARTLLAAPIAGADPTARAFVEARREMVFLRLARLRGARVQAELRADPDVNPPTALIDGPVPGGAATHWKVVLVGAAGGLVLAAFLAYFLAWRRRTA